MEILSIGQHFDHELVKNETLESARSFYDYDFIIINPNNIHNDYLVDNELVDFDSLYDVAIKRNIEIKGYARSSDGIICCFIPEDNNFVDTRLFEREYTEIFHSILDLYIKVVNCSILNFSVNDFPNINSFIEKNAKFLKINKYIVDVKHNESNMGINPLVINKANYTLAGHINSRIFLLPDYQPPKDQNEKSKADKIFIDSLLQLVGIETPNNNHIIKLTIPEWCKNYYLPSEEELIKNKFFLNNQLKEIKQQISSIDNELSNFNNLKTLISLKGTDLENKVASIFRELGFEVKQLNNDRVDLILSYKDKEFVVEVKGKKKSSGEGDARQLEQWVGDSYDEIKGRASKGLLIINAFNETPLNERTNIIFPAQMLKFCEPREHCLMTTTQLLCLYLDCKDNPDKKEQMIDQLFDTVGIFNEYSDWQDIIEYKEEVMPLT